jgi:disks large-associated protein 5
VSQNTKKSKIKMASKLSNRERNYNYKYNGRARGVEERALKKSIASKQKRNDITMNNRAVLSKIQVHENDQASVDTTKLIKSRKREEQLKEWKVKREKEKEIKKSKEKPIFKPSGIANISTKIDTKLSKNKSKNAKTQLSPKQTPTIDIDSAEKVDSLIVDIPPDSVLPVLKKVVKINDAMSNGEMDALLVAHDNKLANAWVPNNAAADALDIDHQVNFESVFKSTPFSPFKFTAARDNVENRLNSKEIFTFRKEITSELIDPPILPPLTTDNEEKGEEDMLVCVPPHDDSNSLPTNRLSDNSIEELNIQLAHNNQYANEQILNEEMLLSPSNAKPVSSPADLKVCLPSSVTEDQLNKVIIEEAPDNDSIGPFRQLHVSVINRLTKQCQVWENKMDELRSQVYQPSPEVISDIHTTICQAKLLMKEKLEQYLYLVELAEKPSDGGLRTTPDDLQGFWDMVYFQVEKIDKKFLSFVEMEGNNWEQVQVTQTEVDNEKKPYRRSKRKACEAAKVKMSERQMGSRAKREESRARLREMKLAAAKKNKLHKMNENKIPTPPPLPVILSQERNDIDLITFSPTPTKITKQITPFAKRERPLLLMDCHISLQKIKIPGNVLSPMTPRRSRRLLKDIN